MNFYNLWPTKLSIGHFHVEGLSDYILTNYDLNTPENGELAGKNFFDNDSKPIKEFKKVVYNCFDEYLQKTINKSISDFTGYRTHAWITKGTNTGMNFHNHRGNLLSAVFYPLAEVTDAGGSIVFHDPRFNANRGYPEPFYHLFEKEEYIPETGDVFIFPSFLYHSISPYFSDFRICVPVDLYLFTE